MQFFRPVALALGLFSALVAGMPAHAQDAAPPAPITGSAFAVDATTIYVDNRPVVLWGIEAPGIEGGALRLMARTAIDDEIAGQPVRCRLAARAPGSNATPKGQCVNAGDRDLALALIERGFGVSNRREVAGSVFFDAYLQAEKKARDTSLGVWAKQGTGAASVQPGLFDNMGTLPFILAVSLGPLIGMLLVAIVMRFGFKRLVDLQKYQIAGAQRREKMLKEREKFVVAAALEGEINTNRAKLDAFLIIYEELLKSLRDPSKKPKYQKSGDIIHDRPALSRTVYDTNLDKIELLGPQLIADLTSLYILVDANPDYQTLEPEMSIDKVIEIVSKIVRDAEKLLDPMDRIAGALNVIVRDKRAQTAAKP